MRFVAVGIALLAASAPALGEVKSAAAGGFEVQSTATVAASPAEAYAALARVSEWWSPEHTFSGRAENLTLDPRVPGCFCEKLSGGGGVEHLRVVYAEPGKMLRLQGGLGPIQSFAAAGTLTWALKPAANGTEIVQTYAVSGYIPMGPEKLAPAVDKVMAEQLGRLQKKLGAIR